AAKRFKKVRAVLRLVRDDLGAKVYRKENVAFRDAGRPLTAVRDARVLVQALDKLAEHFAEDVPPRTFAKVRKVLMADQRAVRRRVLDRDDAFARVTADVEAARERVKGWTLGHNGWAALKGGLERGYRDGYQAFAR